MFCAVRARFPVDSVEQNFQSFWLERGVNLQAGEDTYLQLEFWDENIDLIRKSAAIIRKAGREHRVIVGNPQNAKIWQMCGQELPDVPRILPDTEVCPLLTCCMESCILH